MPAGTAEAARLLAPYAPSLEAGAFVLPISLGSFFAGPLAGAVIAGGYLAFMVLIFGVFASAAAASALGQLRGDELRGRTELLLASGAAKVA